MISTIDTRRLWLVLLLALNVAFVQTSTSAETPSPAYAQALPGYRYQFPRDHGAHTPYRTEWWYYTGNLRATSGTLAGRQFGFELTFFRNRAAPLGNALAQASPLAADEFFMAHFAISDAHGQRHESWQHLGRRAFAQATASTTTLALRMGDWSAQLTPDILSTETMLLSAAAQSTSLSLTLRPARPLVIHGINGVHQKADQPGQASHYYSYTRLNASGTLAWQGAQFAVSGLAWMDHEFGSNQLGAENVGWDWFALQLESDANAHDNAHDELMLYQMRRADGTYNPHSAGTHVNTAGQAVPLPGSEYQIRALDHWTSPASGGNYPQNWDITIPSLNAQLHVTPLFPQQEVRARNGRGTTYWEGAVRIAGTLRGQPTHGSGYVELTGYAAKLKGL